MTDDGDRGDSRDGTSVRALLALFVRSLVEPWYLLGRAARATAWCLTRPWALLARGLRIVLRLPLRAVWWLLGRLLSALRRLAGRARWALFGGPEDYIPRLKVAGLSLLFAVAVFGLFLATKSTSDVSGSSGPFLTTILELGTSGPAFLLYALFSGRGYLFLLGRRKAQRAAEATGYSPSTIRRLAAEAKSADGTRRVIGLPNDSLEGLTERFGDALEDPGFADRLRAQTDASDETEEGKTRRDQSRGPLPIPLTRSDADRERVATTSTDPDHGEGDDASLIGPERRKMAMMDIQSSFNAGRVFWQFGMPSVIVFIFLLLAVQIWVVWWFYLVLAALSMFVGGVTYSVLGWYRRRSLSQLRSDDGSRSESPISALVKPVETDEVTVYIGFMGGRTYAHTDREQFCETMAARTLDQATGLHPAPAIEERYAWLLKNKIPVFERYRGLEKHDIMEHLAEEVRDGEMVPLVQLFNDVVEYDRERKWFGLRFVGYGFDPALVAEAYDDLVPCGLVEETVTVEGPEGEDRDVRAVRTRGVTMHQSVAQVRAQFAEEFRARELPHRYDPPEVDVGGEPPLFVREEGNVQVQDLTALPAPTDATMPGGGSPDPA